MDDVIDWITFYNHSRLHLKLDHISLMQFEKKWVRCQPKASNIKTSVKINVFEGQGQYGYVITFTI